MYSLCLKRGRQTLHHRVKRMGRSWRSSRHSILYMAVLLLALYHFVGDDAFALRNWLMKPFSHRSQVQREIIYSYRLSRARRVIENAFGILSHRFWCFLTTMQQHPETINLIAMCACVLHNLILTRYPLATTDADHEDPATHALIPGAWREDCDMAVLMHLSGHNSKKEAKQQRDYLSYYLSPAGSVPWQERMVNPLSLIHIMSRPKIWTMKIQQHMHI
ncbi:uncharacterized protein LOC117119150 [Anneissia japonica]|uniref:uncharacterized protein LOC117119150 n=1 Tax=Anneissia japonica TaxID=1529436 RepID=UPI0014256DA3|nr:uncharacterized protein LOC117119150 [Anneissia japonica]